MSRKASDTRQKKPRAGSQKSERYIQPSILIMLKRKPSYGYELIQRLSQFGFMEGQAPPGMIYRHLRELEENGLVTSEWQTSGSGPAKRIYRLTAEGTEILDYWIEHMRLQADKLLSFVSTYQALKTEGK
jgi:PadR family transcriptional regulator PadR